ncbi:MAG TPA: hypothetical protein VLS89_07075 [Candidatus Nanopelagicales bacterium]|nr:hypothetical protein [Candidatus Nanopelagicales bacterium]
MADITHGTIVLQVPDHLALPANAGKLSLNELNRLPKPLKGVGRLCGQAADAVQRAGSAFSMPPGVTVQSLREAGERADGIDQFLIDLEVVLQKLQQANRMFDAEAWKQLRQVNGQIKSLMKHDPALKVIFQQVLSAFAVYAKSANAGPVEGEAPVEEATTPA